MPCGVRGGSEGASVRDCGATGHGQWVSVSATVGESTTVGVGGVSNKKKPELLGIGGRANVREHSPMRVCKCREFGKLKLTLPLIPLLLRHRHLPSVPIPQTAGSMPQSSLRSSGSPRPRTAAPPGSAARSHRTVGDEGRGGERARANVYVHVMPTNEIQNPSCAERGFLVLLIESDASVLAREPVLCQYTVHRAQRRWREMREEAKDRTRGSRQKIRVDGAIPGHV